MSEMTAPARRRNDADAPRISRQRTLARRFEQSLLSQFLLEFFEGELQRAVSQRLQQFHDELIFAACLKHIDAAARHYRQSVPRLEFPIAMRGPEGHRAHLRLALLQREVVMAARSQLDAGDFAGDPHVGKCVLERRANGCIQVADGIYAACGSEIKGELIHPLILP